eukprot:TRINITY_DN153_c0_g2_i2.p1 TRINITY_DN153_c0_g2~~TRINITY_DN153_c0_g2_i2.p1  ORF type:complete len:1059 (+),score=566.15 TRINITY_DN153_c0_g2_i2:157-3333(+)
MKWKSVLFVTNVKGILCRCLIFYFCNSVAGESISAPAELIAATEEQLRREDEVTAQRSVELDGADDVDVDDECEDSVDEYDYSIEGTAIDTPRQPTTQFSPIDDVEEIIMEDQSLFADEDVKLEVAHTPTNESVSDMESVVDPNLVDEIIMDDIPQIQEQEEEVVDEYETEQVIEEQVIVDNPEEQQQQQEEEEEQTNIESTNEEVDEHEHDHDFVIVEHNDALVPKEEQESEQNEDISINETEESVVLAETKALVEESAAIVETETVVEESVVETEALVEEDNVETEIVSDVVVETETVVEVKEHQKEDEEQDDDTAIPTTEAESEELTPITEDKTIHEEEEKEEEIKLVETEKVVAPIIEESLVIEKEEEPSKEDATFTSNDVTINTVIIEETPVIPKMDYPAGYSGFVSSSKMDWSSASTPMLKGKTATDVWKVKQHQVEENFESEPTPTNESRQYSSLASFFEKESSNLASKDQHHHVTQTSYKFSSEPLQKAITVSDFINAHAITESSSTIPTKSTSSKSPIIAKSGIVLAPSPSGVIPPMFTYKMQQPIQQKQQSPKQQKSKKSKKSKQQPKQVEEKQQAAEQEQILVAETKENMTSSSTTTTVDVEVEMKENIVDNIVQEVQEVQDEKIEQQQEEDKRIIEEEEEEVVVDEQVTEDVKPINEEPVDVVEEDIVEDGEITEPIAVIEEKIIEEKVQQEKEKEEEQSLEEEEEVENEEITEVVNENIIVNNATAETRIQEEQQKEEEVEEPKEIIVEEEDVIVEEEEGIQEQEQKEEEVVDDDEVQKEEEVVVEEEDKEPVIEEKSQEPIAIEHLEDVLDSDDDEEDNVDEEDIEEGEIVSSDMQTPRKIIEFPKLNTPVGSDVVEPIVITPIKDNSSEDNSVLATPELAVDVKRPTRLNNEELIQRLTPKVAQKISEKPQLILQSVGAGLLTGNGDDGELDSLFDDEHEKHRAESVAEIEAPHLMRFAVHKKLAFGERMLVVGSSHYLGNWNPDSGAPCIWTDGDVWNVEVPICEDTFEYKFVVRSADGSCVWESGSNREGEQSVPVVDFNV